MWIGSGNGSAGAPYSTIAQAVAAAGDGATIEAMAQNREGARLVGINTGRVGMLTFAISGALAAIGASGTAAQAKAAA